MYFKIISIPNLRLFWYYSLYKPPFRAEICIKQLGFGIQASEFRVPRLGSGFSQCWG